MAETKEKQYQYMIELQEKHGITPMSLRANTMYRTDPRLLVFTLSRHKFVAKMLAGYDKVLEMGCGDAFASRLVQQEVKELHAVDFDPVFVEDAQSRQDPQWPIHLAVHDILSGPYTPNGLFDAVYSLDVIEHISPEQEHLYIEHICQSLKPGGVFICGTPSLESQTFASEGSRAGHINCKKGPKLKEMLLQHFSHAFLFGMNDEVLHTGFSPMCHYLFVMATGNKVKVTS
jgi:SAM-dependent methyltransferase